MSSRYSLLVPCTIAFALLLAACEDKPASDAATTAATTAAAAPEPTASAKPEGPPLLHPKAANEEAPAKYKTKFTTTQGEFVIEVERDWAPRAADRFYNLVKIGFYDDMAIHRVVEGFVVQFGIHGDPAVSGAWRKAYMMDEMVKQPNGPWTVTFAKSGVDTRTTQVFINLKDNAADLDKQGFSPFGKVVEGKDVFEKFYAGYGEKVMARGGNTEAFKLGNPYFKDKWPKLDYIQKATIVE